MFQPKMPEAAKLNSRDKGGMAAPMLPTPPATISKMNQTQLKKFIPRLLSQVSGQSKPSFGPHDRPIWWPTDVTWNTLKMDSRTSTLKEVLSADSLKKVVRNCYRHFGQERVLHGNAQRPESASSPVTIINNYYGDVANIVNNQTINLCDTKQWAKMPSDSPKPSPRTRLVNRSLLPSLGHRGQTPMEAYPQLDIQPFVEIFICFFCEKEFGDKLEMTQHQGHCKERPPELQAILTPPRPSHHVNPPQISPALPRCSVPRPPKPDFMKHLNLVQCHKAKQIKAKFRESTDVDCEIIDVVEPPKTPTPATPPRTPRSLISQLSRDDPWPRRKSLSLTWNLHDVSDKESVCSGASENEPEELGKCPRNATLLSIPLSSLLGQRVRKHVKVEGLSTAVPDVERFCKTPVKNAALQRLRERHNTFPVTFKKTRRMKAKHVHEFKFNKRQRAEFLDCVKVGLNRKSLRLFKKIKKCSVKLERLTKDDLKQWLMPPKPKPAPAPPYQQILWGSPQFQMMLSNNTIQVLRIDPVFPDQPGLLSADVDRLLGLKKKPLPCNRQHQPSLPLGSMVSEHLNAEASQQKLTVYRSLLSEYSNSHSAQQQQNPNFATKNPLTAPKLNNSCLTNLLNKHRVTEQGPAPQPQMRTLLSKPANATSSHVENWLSSNSFTGEVRPCLLVKNANSPNPTVTVINKPVHSNTQGQAAKRPHSGPTIESSNKRRCVVSKETKSQDDDQSSCTSDSISIRTVSSSDDEDETLINLRLRKNQTIPPNNGLPVIQNTFSLAPEHYRLLSSSTPENGQESSNLSKLRIPSDLRLQIPTSVPQVATPTVRTQPNILRSRSQTSRSPATPQKPQISLCPTPNLANSSPRPAGHYSLRSISPAKEVTPRVLSTLALNPQPPVSKIPISPLKLHFRLGTLNLKPLASSTPNLKLPASSTPNADSSPRRRSQRLQSSSQGSEPVSTASESHKQADENREALHEVIVID